MNNTIQSPHSPRQWPWTARLYLWTTERLYHEFAWAYDWVSWWVSLGHWSRWRSDALRHVTGYQVLEIGFGTGDLLLDMAGRGWQVYGLDLSPAMHRVTARKMRRRGLWVPRVRARAQAMPFADHSFDAVIATFPSQYILSLATLREVARLLCRPDPDVGIQGGRFIIAGLYFETDSALLCFAARLVYGRGMMQAADWYRRFAAQAGFTLTIVSDPDARFRSPVLILEHTNA